MKIIIEDSDIEELRKKVEKAIITQTDDVFREKLTENIAKMIDNDILFRKSIHDRIMKLKQFEIDELNKQFEEAYNLLKKRSKK